MRLGQAEEAGRRSCGAPDGPTEGSPSQADVFLVLNHQEDTNITVFLWR